MRISPLRIALIFLLLQFGISGSVLVGQDAAVDSSKVRPKITLSVETNSGVGENGFLNADFVIPVGLHQLKIEDFFYLKPDQTDGLSWGAPVYSPTKGDISGIPSYTTTARISIPFSGQSRLLDGLSVRAGWQLCYDDGVCLRPDSIILSVQGFNRSDVAFPWLSMLLYIAAGILGGFLLNLMPCVLPVITLKVMGILKSGTVEKENASKKFMLNAAGIGFSMILLAIATMTIKLFGQSAGWGFQFQNVYFQLALIILMWLMALSFMGVWEAGTVFGNKTGKVSGAGDFFSGVLVVILATPCTAPFLGSALGFAFASPIWAIPVIFLSAAIGLSLPFLLLAAFPQVIRFFPKPGPWMEKLKVILGFFMTTVALWLVWVYSYSRPDGVFPLLLFLLILALMAWIFGQRQKVSGKAKKIILIAVLLAISILSAVFLVRDFSPFGNRKEGDLIEPVGKTELPAPWEKFDEDRTEDSLAVGRIVFVDFSARWCLTCQVNETGVLASGDFLQSAEEANVLLLRGDYTNADPVIEDWLNRYRRAGVPFYALLRPGKKAVIFNELLGPGFVNEFRTAAGLE